MYLLHLLFLFLLSWCLHGTDAAPARKQNMTSKDDQFILFPAPNQNVIVVNDEFIYFPPSPTGDSNRCLYITTAPEWQGEVTYGCTEANFCQKYPFPVMSFGPDVNAGVCELFETEDCTGPSVSTQWPGFRVMPDGWDNRVQGFKCYGLSLCV